MFKGEEKHDIFDRGVWQAILCSSPPVCYSLVQ